jgi:Rad3-related DNA helicase
MPLLTPSKLDLPQFDSWRDQQPGAIVELIEALTPVEDGGGGYDTAVLPDQAGFGKSGVYLGLSQLMRRSGSVRRTIIMTQSRGLQDQVGRDATFSQDMKGRANYPCKYSGSRTKFLTCKTGPDHGCDVGDTCTYNNRKNICANHHTVVTNYACRLSMSLYPNAKGLGDFDLNVLDEAHLVPDEITRALAVELDGGEQARVLNDIDMPTPATPNGWQPVARKWLHWYASEYTSMDGNGAVQDDADSEAKDLKDKLVKVATCSGHENWLTYHKEGDGTLYMDVIWPGLYAKSALYPTGKVLLTSATITAKSLSQLGIARDKVYWRNTGGQFDPRRWPAVWIKTCQVKQSMPSHAKSKLLNTIDQIIRTRAVEGNRNGIIITPSYDLAKWIKQESMYGQRIVVPTTATTRMEVDRFKSPTSLHRGAVLCSPAIGTGYDFPGDTSRWVIVPKVPYTYHGDPLTRARQERDGRYSDGLVAQELAQMVSRCMRGPADWCEVFVLDDLIAPFINRNRDLMVDWFPLFEHRGIRAVDWLPRLMEVPNG